MHKKTLLEPHRSIAAIRSAAVIGIICGLATGELIIGVGAGIVTGLGSYWLRPIVVNFRVNQLKKQIKK